MHRHTRLVTALLVTTVVGCCAARVIQEGEEDATCFPVDFESHRWVLAGNTWFTETRGRLPWLKSRDECAQIEPGRTTIGGLRNALENKRLRDHFHDNNYYINAVQIGGKEWYWCTQKSGEPIKMENMTWTNWAKNEPSSEGETCVETIFESKVWNDVGCTGLRRGVCELRCDSL